MVSHDRRSFIAAPVDALNGAPLSPVISPGWPGLDHLIREDSVMLVPSFSGLFYFFRM